MINQQSLRSVMWWFFPPVLTCITCIHFDSTKHFVSPTVSGDLYWFPWYFPKDIWQTWPEFTCRRLYNVKERQRTAIMNTIMCFMPSRFLGLIGRTFIPHSLYHKSMIRCLSVSIDQSASVIGHGGRFGFIHSFQFEPPQNLRSLTLKKGYTRTLASLSSYHNVRCDKSKMIHYCMLLASPTF